MAHLDRKTVFDAGASKPTNIEENESGDNPSTPRSAYAITESVPLVFTNDRICRDYHRELNIADGDQRPGTAGS